MIVAVGAAKGGPGVTTAAVALGMVWPTERLVVEADPSGADLPFRVHAAGGGRLDPQRSVTELANAARVGAPQPVSAFGQDTTLGVPVVPGALGPETFRGTANLWPRIAAVCAAWPGTVLADLGRVQPGHPALPVAKLAVGMVLLGRPTPGGLYRLRARAAELAATLGDPARPRSPLAVVLVCPAREGKRAVADVTQMLDAARLPVPVAGWLAWDPRSVAALQAGGLPRRGRRSELVASARAVAQTLFSWWPELSAATPVAWTADGAPGAAQAQGVPA